MTADIIDFKSRKKTETGSVPENNEAPVSPALDDLVGVLDHFRSTGIPYNRAILILVADDCDPKDAGFTGATVNVSAPMGLGYMRLSEEILINQLHVPLASE